MREFSERQYPTSRFARLNRRADPGATRARSRKDEGFPTDSLCHRLEKSTISRGEDSMSVRQGNARLFPDGGNAPTPALTFPCLDSPHGVVDTVEIVGSFGIRRAFSTCNSAVVDHLDLVDVLRGAIAPMFDAYGHAISWVALVRQARRDI
jgi:hypothetical protein